MLKKDGNVSNTEDKAKDQIKLKKPILILDFSKTVTTPPNQTKINKRVQIKPISRIRN